MPIRLFRVGPGCSIELPNGVFHAMAGQVMQAPSGCPTIDRLLADNGHKLRPYEGDLPPEPWWAGLWPELLRAGYDVRGGLAVERAPERLACAVAAPGVHGAVPAPETHAAVLGPPRAASGQARGHRRGGRTP